MLKITTYKKYLQEFCNEEVIEFPIDDFLIYIREKELCKISLEKKKWLAKYRNEMIFKMREKEYTLREISSIVGITFQGVDEVLKNKEG